MPYIAKGKCVYKKTKDGKPGKRVGCTKGSVKKYLAALHANVHESLNECVDFRGVTMPDNKSEAFVHYTLTDNPKVKLTLSFKQLNDPELEYPYDYAQGSLTDEQGNVHKFIDPSKFKGTLKQYGMVPDDIENLFRPSLEEIDAKINKMNFADGVDDSYLTFESLYAKIMRS